MPLIYLIFLALAFSYPQVGHEAGLATDNTGYLGANALISRDALISPKGNAVPEILAKIAACESGDRHFDAGGKVVRGKYNRYDLGRYQINLKYWHEKAEELGYNLSAEAGNEAFALWLYREYGTAPWKQSRECWEG